MRDSCGTCMQVIKMLYATYIGMYLIRTFSFSTCCEATLCDAENLLALKPIASVLKAISKDGRNVTDGLRHEGIAGLLCVYADH